MRVCRDRCLSIAIGESNAAFPLDIIGADERNARARYSGFLKNPSGSGLEFFDGGRSGIFRRGAG